MKYRKTYLNACSSWYLTHPLNFIDQLCKEIRAFIQRACRGYADCDVWDFSSYLEDILAGGLKQLSKGISYPGTGKMDNPEKWEQSLLLNVKRFEDVKQYEYVGWEDDRDLKKREKVYKERDKALKFVVKWWDSLWD